MKIRLIKLVFWMLWYLISFTSWGQATIKENKQILKTYGFGNPNPVPITSDNPKIAPYFKFYDYEKEALDREWKVVTLENDYIKVWVLPEIGGKVWGAVEKSTGNEFIYKNEVIKFRNIAMRGPWTSGGIEFNFGIIGHHPSTATPVNYSTKSNADGSVSCIVGNEDLPSNTHWAVEIRLEADKAYFETNASWYNASELPESYYNWMTGAAVATKDLEFFVPGTAYLEHNGTANPWPSDNKGRNLALYKENNFGGDKSYHVVGAFQNYFGGYYHDRKVGFGQWAPYEEMPGQKLWLWSLSRSGGIWEDLLTDNDGQYVEFQAGRLFDQYFPGAINPISQVAFSPYLMDRWSEIWFPIKDIGGLEAVSKAGILNVEYVEDTAQIGLNALQSLNHTLEISLNGNVKGKHSIRMLPMEVFQTQIPFVEGDSLVVRLLETDLIYTNKQDAFSLKRPFYPAVDLMVSKSQEYYQEALEAIEFRAYSQGRLLLEKLVSEDPSHREGLVKLAELEYRNANYSGALKLANRVLQMDTYSPDANYITAICYRKLGDSLNALESLGWAARDIAHRSVAYAQMAEIHLGQLNYEKAEYYSKKALNFNAFSINAYEVLLIVYRKTKNRKDFLEILESLKKIAPLNHFAAIEQQFEKNGLGALVTWDFLKNELPFETIGTLAIKYHDFNLLEEAKLILQNLPSNPKNQIYLAYLTHKSEPTKGMDILNEVVRDPIEFAFPYQRETIPVLEWATVMIDHWKLKYLLAQNYIAVGNEREGIARLVSLRNDPTEESFYRFRAQMNRAAPYEEKEIDYSKALELAPHKWKVWEEAIQFQLSEGEYEKSLTLSTKAYRKFRDNYSIGLAHAKALLLNKQERKTLEVMRGTVILPFEHASESKKIYNEAHYALILAALQKGEYNIAMRLIGDVKEWPENLGVGRPFNPDERLEDYAMAFCTKKVNGSEKSDVLLNKILNYNNEAGNDSGKNILFSLLALKNRGRIKEAEQKIEDLKIKSDFDENTKLGIALYLDPQFEPQNLESKKSLNSNEYDLLKYLSNQTF